MLMVIFLPSNQWCDILILRSAVDSVKSWQHHGNKKSDSLYYLNNGNNANTLS